MAGPFKFIGAPERVIRIAGSDLLEPLVVKARDAAAAAGDFRDEVQGAIASAAEYRNDTQLIYNNTVAAIAQADLGQIFPTLAELTAVAGTIAEGGYAQVVADEGRQDHRTLYRKQSGVITFVLDFDLGQVLYPEAFGAVCYATRAEAAAGIDSTDAFEALIAAWHALGGGVIFLSGWYCLIRALLLPNANTEDVIGTQPPLTIDGIGGNKTYARPVGGSGLIWIAETGAAVAKIDTRGRGSLHFGRITLASASDSGLTKPFIHTTYTTITNDPTFAIDGQSYVDPTEDGIILGGTANHELDDTDRRSADCGFQGYGTVIDRAYFNGLKCCVRLRRYANAVRITNNTVWNTCRQLSDRGAAFEVDGAPNDDGGFATGTVFFGNLIEVTYYRYGIYLKNSAAAFVAGNDCYDAIGDTLGGVYVGDNCIDPRIIPSLAPATKPYVIDPAGAALIFGSEAGEYDRMRALIAGRVGTPNKFGPTNFESPSGTIFQEQVFALAGNGPQLQLKRADDAAVNPGGNIFRPWADGRIEIGGGAEAGNIYNDQAGAAQWTNRGRRWGVTDGPGYGRGDGNMSQDSGPGGGIYTAINYRFVFQDHTFTNVARVSNECGGIGAAGIAFGAGLDVELYRYSSTVVKTGAKLVATGGLGVGNSATATTPGAVTKKIEVFDATGASLGFVPIYDAIT